MSGIDPALAAKVLASFDEFNDAMSKRTPTDSDVSGFIAAHNAICYENQDLRSALAESARTIEGIRDELMAANLDVSTDDDSATFAHHVFVLRMALEERGDHLTTALTERDEARSRLVKAREEIESIDEAVLSAELDTAEAIAAWLCGLTADTPMNRRDFGCQQERAEAVAKMLAADIRANAWRSK